METVILSKSTAMLLPKPSTFSSRAPPRQCLSLSKSLRSHWRLRGRRFASSPSEGLRVSVTCGVREIDEKEFPNAVLSSDRPVLVEFVAAWCAPCRLITPFMEWLAQEYEDRMTIVKIDHDANSELIKEYKVYGLPTLILFKNGKEVPGSRREGAISKAKLQEYVEALLV